MATKSSIHIKPCNITSSEAHNRRTPEYMRNIGDSKIYIVPELSADNEQWINPSFGNVALQTHYDNIKRMVKEKTGRAMQEKERERKGKNGKIIKVAGCSPIREVWGIERSVFSVIGENSRNALKIKWFSCA